MKELLIRIEICRALLPHSTSGRELTPDELEAFDTFLQEMSDFINNEEVDDLGKPYARRVHTCCRAALKG